MQLRYVFTETAIGLRRNLTMTIALVVTIFVSLTLVGMGILLNAQAKKAEAFWGSKLQIKVVMCNQYSRGPLCATGPVNATQKAAIREVLSTHPEVRSFDLQTKKEAFEAWKRVYLTGNGEDREVYSEIRPTDMRESFQVTLKDPQEYRGVESAVRGMDGVDSVSDLREVLNPIYGAIDKMKWGAIGIAAFLFLGAILQVGNTIRLATFARRKEIGIMRLVGASNLSISLPFVLETLTAALIGFGAAALTLVGIEQFVVYGSLRNKVKIVEWVDWGDLGIAVAGMGILAVLITVLPTLVMTRKYLKI